MKLKWKVVIGDLQLEIAVEGSEHECYRIYLKIERADELRIENDDRSEHAPQLAN